MSNIFSFFTPKDKKFQPLFEQAGSNVRKISEALLVVVTTDDLETRKDQEHIDFYTARIEQMGYTAKGVLGYASRSAEIVRLVKENKADMLVIGAHGHAGLKDWFYGETIDAVRHELKIPVLVVHV
jgi:manganese transport protein